jgi:hypothetical protein
LKSGQLYTGPTPNPAIAQLNLKRRADPPCAPT